MIEAGEGLSVEALIRLGKKVETELAASTKLPLYFSYPLAFSPLGKMFGRDGTGCGICGIRGVIGVLADGSYAMCGIGETVRDLVFGHAAKDSLADVWAKTPAINELREGLPERLDGVCGNCTMKRICQGFCVAHNYNRHKNLWAPYWFCELAEKQGLFPPSRMMIKE
jgi:SynChlorMet cassette radical SAM/SPASM protein ScmF